MCSAPYLEIIGAIMIIPAVIYALSWSHGHSWF